MNKFKINIGSVLSEHWLLGKNPNWTEVLGSVAAAINSQHGRAIRTMSLCLRLCMVKCLTMNCHAQRRKLASAGQFHNSCE